jgi:hypothetical protein
VISVIAPRALFAQSISTVSLSLSPENPSPGDMVSVSVSALNFNINLAKIVWSVDGKAVKSGIGETTFIHSAPAAGKSTTISVAVTPQGSTSIEDSIVITPSGNLDIIIESADGYAPPFYKGKILPIAQSQIRVVAIPDVRLSTGSSAKAGDFVYTWKKDGTNMPSQSGFGNNSFIFANQILDTTNRIDVSATNGVKEVHGSIIITPFQPDIVMYEYDQSKGMPSYQKAFGPSATISQPRITVVVEPYFLARDWKTNDKIQLGWKINNTAAKAGEKNTLGITTSTKGTFNIEADYHETQRLFRDVKANLQLNVQ